MLRNSIPPFVNRLNDECSELNKKINSIKIFKKDYTYKELKLYDKFLLSFQYIIMKIYLKILYKRLSRILKNLKINN